MFSVARSAACRSRQSLAFLSLCLALAGVPRPATAAAWTTPAGPVALVLAQGYVEEVEPNNSPANANAISGTSAVIKGHLTDFGDRDVFSFQANAGDRVYAALMTSGSAAWTTDSRLTLLAADGTTVIELDEDDGSFSTQSSSIANATLPADGTYYLQVDEFAEFPLLGYELHLRVQAAAEAPTPETEPNDTPATANALPANGWVSGTRSPAAAAEQDWYRFTANAGDTVFLSLDLNPERDGVVWNGRLGLGLFGDAADQVLFADDPGDGDVPPVPHNPSEALFFTVKTTGTYFAVVDSASAAVGGAAATYTLSVSIHPATNEGVSCTTYTSTDVPKTIGPGTGLVSSVITVPGHPRIADVDVTVTLDHALMQDVDAHLRSPAGNDNGLFTDIGSGAPGGQTRLDVTFDDEAGIPPAFPALRNVQLKPENNAADETTGTHPSGAYRLSWFDGEDAGGTWTLDLRDDAAGNGGTLTAWSLRICEPAPPCPPGLAPQTVFSTDFESGPAGFTTLPTPPGSNEWELGLPATIATTGANPVAAFDSCHSGVNCWKTDLDGTYENGIQQELISPPIDMTGVQPPIFVRWAQRHQLETGHLDSISVYTLPNFTNVYRWLDPTPVSASAATGNPQADIGGSAGWGVYTRRADSLVGSQAGVVFHMHTNSTVALGGWAVDDVSVIGCRPATADLSITKTDGVTTATAGGSVTYTITASNAGPDLMAGATVTDDFPASLTCAWTCAGAGGGTCAAVAGTGDINEAVHLPAGGSATYTATCAVDPAATGTLSNTATIANPGTEPNPADNTATDTDTLTAAADVALTMAVDNPTPTVGSNVTYTVTARNNGPSDAHAVRVTDRLPTGLTLVSATPSAGTYTPASGAWLIGTLASGASATLALQATVTSSLAIVNQASVTAQTEPDPNRSNNSAYVPINAPGLADVQMRMTVDDDTPAVGQNVTFTVTAYNDGPTAATDVDVLDNVPTGLTFVSSTPSQGFYDFATGFWSVGTIAPGATATLTVVATVTTAAPVFRRVHKNQDEPDYVPVNDTDSVSLNDGTVADMAIGVIASQEPVPAGATFNYTATALNLGPATATNVVVTFTLPPTGVLINGAGATQGTCSATISVVTCNLGALADGLSANVLLTVTKIVGGSVSSTASVTAAQPDPYLGNNTNAETSTPAELTNFSVE
jgi:uncharacterized repeat protein (TIGR01451 family)